MSARAPSLFRARLWHIVGLLALGVMGFVVYDLQLQFTNAYMGYLAIDLDGRFIASLLAFCIGMGFLIPPRITKPSEIFLVLYGTFVVLSYVVFYDGASEVSFGGFCYRLLLTFLPFLVIRMAALARWRLTIPFDLRRETMTAIVVGIAFSGVAVALYSSGSSGGFSIADAYDRRMIGRDVFQAGSLVAYLNVMTMNGVNPFLAFLAGLLNRKLLLAISLGFAAVFFYSIGVKAPTAFAALAFLIGVGVRTGNLSILFNMILLATVLLFVGFVVEYSMNGYSEIAEYFFRRVYIIPGFDVQRYMELIFDRGASLWSPVSGIQSDLGVTYLVGATFFGSDQANVNTNAFTYALAAGGYVGYAAIVLGVAAFFKLLDALFEGSGNVAYLYIGFLYAILLAEQAATTAFVSSGVGLLFFLVVLSGRGWHSEAVVVPRRSPRTKPVQV